MSYCPTPCTTHLVRPTYFGNQCFWFRYSRPKVAFCFIRIKPPASTFGCFRLLNPNGNVMLTSQKCHEYLFVTMICLDRWSGRVWGLIWLAHSGPAHYTVPRDKMSGSITRCPCSCILNFRIEYRAYSVFVPPANNHCSSSPLFIPPSSFNALSFSPHCFLRPGYTGTIAYITAWSQIMPKLKAH